MQLEIRTDGEIYLDFNPTSNFWAHTEVLTKDNSQHLILTYKDNEALSQDIIDSLELNRQRAATSTYWENWCRVYLDGEVGQIEGTIFSDYLVIDRIPDDARILCYGLDFGFIMFLQGLYQDIIRCSL